MLTRTLRIGSKPRIEYILKRGYQTRGNLFYFRYLPNKLGRMRFSFLVSGKISKKAVERNLVRRRVYEALRVNMPSLFSQKSKTCYDVVVLCTVRVKTTLYRDIERDLINCMKKLIMLHPTGALIA